MKRWVFAIIVIGLLTLAGCIPGLDDVIGPIGGDSSGPSYVLVEYQISTTVVRADTGDEPKILTASIGSLGDISYDPDLHIVTCDATAGDLLVQMWIYLNEADDMIDYIKIRRINSHLFGAWMRYDFIESYSVSSAPIELVQTVDGNKIFRVDANTLFVGGFCGSIKTVEWREWRTDPMFGESQQVPLYRLKDPFSTLYHDCDDAGNYVDITLEYD